MVVRLKAPILLSERGTFEGLQSGIRLGVHLPEFVNSITCECLPAFRSTIGVLLQLIIQFICEIRSNILLCPLNKCCSYTISIGVALLGIILRQLPTVFVVVDYITVDALNISCFARFGVNFIPSAVKNLRLCFKGFEILCVGIIMTSGVILGS